MSVHQSVRPSHVGIESKRLHISSKFFSPSGSPTILVFPHQAGWQYSDGNPSPTREASNTRGYKKARFRPISRFISQMLQYISIGTMEGEYETAPKLSNGTGLNDLE